MITAKSKLDHSGAILVAHRYKGWWDKTSLYPGCKLFPLTALLFRGWHKGSWVKDIFSTIAAASSQNDSWMIYRDGAENDWPLDSNPEPPLRLVPSPRISFHQELVCIKLRSGWLLLDVWLVGWLVEVAWQSSRGWGGLGGLVQL